MKIDIKEEETSYYDSFLFEDDPAQKDYTNEGLSLKKYDKLI